MALMESPFKIILGSSSMPRQHILAEMGYDFTVMTADIDEKAIRKDKPEELVTALAEAKADAILSSLQNVDSFVEDVHTTLLITADTVVVHEGRIREKPSSKDEARNFIEGYSGGRAEVVGSVLVTNLKTGRREAGWERAEVYFYDIPAEVVQSLIDEGITLNVAGGLMLEHPLTSPIIKEVIGTADTIMGLPKSLTERLIQEALTRPSSEACRNPA
ncbi:7-methyl-GTP pyrophosphatase isoform X2 [Eucalyptus grandis]|uniref:7-methyl-GTP pyrophosphatase isoform X2 n=1 Tax=Eucalyptus grandis TaxID=71139 RepID=UPI0005276F71|nr:7-methyl-GTP pyrophosphatase isoform X2 [Eucalyptus grandis]